MISLLRQNGFFCNKVLLPPQLENNSVGFGDIEEFISFLKNNNIKTVLYNTIYESIEDYLITEELLQEFRLDDIIEDMTKKFNLQKEVEEKSTIIRKHIKEAVNQDLKRDRKKSVNLISTKVAAFSAAVILVQCFDLYEVGWGNLFSSREELYIFVAYQSPHAINHAESIFKMYEDERDRMIEILKLAIWGATQYGGIYFRDFIESHYFPDYCPEEEE